MTTAANESPVVVALRRKERVSVSVNEALVNRCTPFTLRLKQNARGAYVAWDWGWRSSSVIYAIGMTPLLIILIELVAFQSSLFWLPMSILLFLLFIVLVYFVSSCRRIVIHEERRECEIQRWRLFRCYDSVSGPPSLFVATAAFVNSSPNTSHSWSTRHRLLFLVVGGQYCVLAADSKNRGDVELVFDEFEDIFGVPVKESLVHISADARHMLLPRLI